MGNKDTSLNNLTGGCLRLNNLSVSPLPPFIADLYNKCSYESSLEKQTNDKHAAGQIYTETSSVGDLVSVPIQDSPSD